MGWSGGKLVHKWVAVSWVKVACSVVRKMVKEVGVSVLVTDLQWVEIGERK